ncbi:glycine betaine/L-proline ABC transporter substrate-binding protein ProX [Candidatus Poriferisocius sp.]|uniref:glycine betaine/L-proline ABC transporter substrate-binding protein ProX n=1 Tax=Candidatus Poriferisocius sp. TaxID=3101276 RepID=UPI003B5B7519
MALPGEGVSVSMARANWSTGYMQAAIYEALLSELGYEVSNPAEAELAPATFYPALGEGEYDLWVNGWFPIHDTFLDGDVGQVAQPIGNEITAGGLQGFIVDIATAEANGITMLDDIGNNPEIAALFDVDGNGKADLMGCNDGWGCQVVINDTIARNGWEDTIEQVSAEHAALFADSVGRYQRGEPILQYVWTPGAFTAQLVPGIDVIWVSVGDPMPDQIGAAALPAEQCPGQPCEMGFVAADIRVVARNEFLSANPAAARLLELVTIPVVDVALQNLDYDAGANTEDDVRAAAADWISANRATVDDWLNQARNASGFTPAPAPEPVSDTPGEGVSVSMARANWSTGYMQAAIYEALLSELGYEVSNPAEAELAPATFYPALGEGEYDLWVNGWFPIHDTFLDGDVGQVAQPIGNEITAGGLQGFIVDIATAEANGITMLDDIGNNPEIAALFDVDGNGKADLMGCNDGWGCQVVINDTIARNGWEDTIEQVSAEHAALFADSVGRYQRGEPILQYVWTPGAFTAQLVPGIDVIWVSVGDPMPDQIGAAALPAEQCPGQPCEMGFVAADIRVVARNEFLSANPAAARLLELVTIPVVDVALQNLDYDAGANTEDDVRAAAADWISANRATVDDWLNQARNAS